MTGCHYSLPLSVALSGLLALCSIGVMVAIIEWRQRR